jgi:hypothetical protein
MSEEKCPEFEDICAYCLEPDEDLQPFEDEDKVCPLCIEHFRNEDDWHEDAMRKQEKEMYLG